MAQITDLSEVRQKRHKKRTRKGLLLIVIILLLTFTLSVLFSSREKYGFSSLTDWFQSGNGYPIEAPGGKSKGMYELNGLLCVVNDTDLLMYNAKGGEVFSGKHQMADPQARIDDSMLLLFDQGAKSYTLYQNHVPLVDSETDYVIYNGAVSSKGSFALSTRSEDYLSQVTVYDKNGREQYSWNYSNKIVTCIALSQSGNHLAVSGLYTEDGTMKSQLLLYYNGELVDSREFNDAVLCSLVFVGENEIKGISDRGAFVISSKGKLLGEYDYQSQPLSAYCNSAESTVVLLGDYRQNGGYHVVALDQSMNRKSSTEIKGNIHVMKADANNVYLLAGNQYYQIDLAGGEHLAEEKSEYLYDLQPIGKGVFAITNEEIIRIEQVKAEERQQSSVIPEKTNEADDLDWEDGETSLPEEETPGESVPEAGMPEEQPDPTQDLFSDGEIKPGEPGL